MPVRFIVAVLLAATLVAGCSGDDQSVATPTPGEPLETVVFTIPPTRPPALPRYPSAVRVIEVSNGASTVLFESLDELAREAQFVEGEDAVRVATQALNGTPVPTHMLILGFDGKVVRSEAITMACREVMGGVEVASRVYADADCGPISPDGKWMTYSVTVGEETLPSGYQRPIWDQWAVNLLTDDRRVLQEGLRHCGGCDGRYGPEWSPAGRYVFYSEWASGGSVFLSDLETGATRLLSTGDTEVTGKPEWSRDRDVLLYKGTNGVVQLEDLGSRARGELTSLSWPARFDPSGRFVYTSAGSSTSILNVAGRQVVALLNGHPERQGALRLYYAAAFPAFESVVASGDSFVAALAEAPGCDGTVVYRGAALVACVRGAVAAMISPDGTKVALYRKTGETGPATMPGQREIALSLFDILLVDTSTGSERVVARDIASIDCPSPVLWNATATHLLVRWPAACGP